MPAFPWTSRDAVDPDRTYVVMASRLPLRRSRSVPGFLRDTLAIRRQLADADGLVGYALDANLPHRTFWTFSVWVDEASLDAFATSAPHRQIIARLGPLMGETGFSTSTMTGSDIPSTWAQRKALVS
jgi:hypothetical protein